MFNYPISDGPMEEVVYVKMVKVVAYQIMFMKDGENFRGVVNKGWIEFVLYLGRWVLKFFNSR